ncbi:MAG: hypothetical protein DRQ55_15585 [Planctomycetota bacterium]|nr:MAG: hypothetical protein DRQ55_15585 [Planctomycetota bacterium]
MRIATALDRYVLQLQADGRSPLTIAQIERHVRLFARWLAEHKLPTDVRRVTHETISRALASDAVRLRLDGKPRSPAASNAIRSSLRTYFAYVHAAGYSSRNAAALVRRARVGPRPPRALTEDETKRLVAALDEAETVAERRDRVLIRVLLATGARIGSALAATTDDVDLAVGTLHLRQMKGGGTQSVPLDRPTRRLLAKHVAGIGPGPLFPSRQGGPVSRRVIALRFTDWLRRAGIDRMASLHALRHTRGHEVYRETRDVLAVARALGHRSVSSAAIYAGGMR